MADVIAILEAPDGAVGTWRGAVFASLEELSRVLTRCQAPGRYAIVHRATVALLERGTRQQLGDGRWFDETLRRLGCGGAR